MIKIIALNCRFVLVAAVLFTAVWTSSSSAQTSTTAAQVDVNSADLKTLETLPGVGPATAQKIVDGRPYSKLSDLGKIKGLSDARLAAMKNLVTFGSADTAQVPDNTQAASKKLTAAATTATAATPVDVNSADLKTLETLPGVGPATAQKIVDGRPYTTLADLGKIKGLSSNRLAAMKDLVTFGSADATPAPVETHTMKKVSTAASTAAGQTDSTMSTAAKASDVSKLAPGEQLNINTASAADLDKLPGIGPTKAQAIVDYRNQNGNFKSIEDIEKVKGIKAGVFAKIKDSIKVSN